MTDEVIEIPATLIRVVDLETTGTETDENAEVVEMASIDLDLASMTVSDGWSSLCSINRGIPAEAKAVHHITEADLIGRRPAGELWPDMLGGLDKRRIFAAHNAKFEQHFFPPTTPEEAPEWICTYKCAKVIWPDAPGHGNQVLRYWLDVDEDGDFHTTSAMPPHRALPDAYVTAFILRRLLGERSVDELITISAYPALSTKITFGKHRGKRYDEVPFDYLEWVRDKSDLDEDTKFSARYWIQKRLAS